MPSSGPSVWGGPSGSGTPTTPTVPDGRNTRNRIVFLHLLSCDFKRSVDELYKFTDRVNVESYREGRPYYWCRLLLTVLTSRTTLVSGQNSGRTLVNERGDLFVYRPRSHEKSNVLAIHCVRLCPLHRHDLKPGAGRPRQTRELGKYRESSSPTQS